MPEDAPVRLVLTPEQRELVHRVSGQHVDAIELQPNQADDSDGVLRLLWRLSAASGIPRQVWQSGDSDDAASKNA